MGKSWTCGCCLFLAAEPISALALARRWDLGLLSWPEYFLFLDGTGMAASWSAGVWPWGLAFCVEQVDCNLGGGRGEDSVAC